MSRSTDPGHFFQTDASEATRARRAAKSSNKNGNPIKLQSKLLAVIADPHDASSVYVAESAGCVRKVNVKTRDTKSVYRGPQAPLTSVALGERDGSLIFAGCWDKDVWAWNRESQTLTRRFKGHSDFVKTVICAILDGRDALISGGADAKIIVWDTASGTKIHALRDKMDTMLAVQYLAIDPIGSTSSSLVLLSSSSDPQIRRWTIDSNSWSQILNDPQSSIKEAKLTESADGIKAHETSVYCLTFTSTDCEQPEDCDLWSASADGTAKCLSRSRDWAVDEVLEHGDYVRAVALSTEFVVTAGRSEDLKVWRRDTGKLWHVFGGHFEEVTGLVVLGLESASEIVVSISIDGTVRTWPLDKAGIDKSRKEQEEAVKGAAAGVVIMPVKKSLMTAEEEAELADLMDDSE